MPTYINDNGTWREVNQSLNVNDNGTNREIDEAYVNDNGTWREVYSAEKLMQATTSFKIGGYKFGSGGGTGTSNVSLAGYNNGEITLTSFSLLDGRMFGRFSTDFRLLNTASLWQDINTVYRTAGNVGLLYQSFSVGVTPNQFLAIVQGNLYPDYANNQIDAPNSPNDPFTGNPPTGGSITTATYNTASTANGTTNTQGTSAILRQMFIGGNVSSVPSDPDRLYAVISCTSSTFSSIFPGRGLTLTTPSYYIGFSEIPGDTFTTCFKLNEATVSLPAQTNIGTSVKAVRTPSSFGFLKDDGDREGNLYQKLHGQTFTGQYFVRSPQIEIYDRINLPFISSSGGIEYREVMSLMWQYEQHGQNNSTPATDPQILFAVAGHGLPANAWRRMEINGISFNASLFTKSEVAANTINPAYTLWSYTYTGANSVTAFGAMKSIININIYK